MTVSVLQSVNTTMRSIVITLLFSNATVAAFVHHGPHIFVDLKHRPLGSFAKAIASQPIPTIPRASTWGSLRRSVMTIESQDTPSWRYQVDDFMKAVSPWGSRVEAEVIATDLFKQLPEVAKDVTDAARKGKLLSNVLLAEGTEARFTVEGLRAVNRQLREDILPQALEAAPRIAKAAASSPSPMRTKGSPGNVGVGTQASTRTRKSDGRVGPMEGVAEKLYAVRNAARDLSPNKVTKGIQTIASELENVLSRKPRGLYSPDYSVEDAREGFEIRRYASYAVCSAPMITTGDVTTLAAEAEDLSAVTVTTTAGSGEGFNTLAGYLFGNNTQERAMDMTTPVNIDVSPAGGRTMSFVMPKDIPAGEAPTPRDPRIGVTDVADGELLAVREFPGFATDGEVKRQVEAMLGALEREATHPWQEKRSSGGGNADTFGTAGIETVTSTSKSPWRAEDPSGMSYRLMQYNPPYTLPWVRTNSVAVRVVNVASLGPVSTSTSTSAAEGAAETAGVTDVATDKNGDDSVEALSNAPGV